MDNKSTEISDLARVKTSSLPYRGLPNELIEQIFDIIYVEDLPTLKSCSYVDHLFCNLAQRRIMRMAALAQIAVPSGSNSLPVMKSIPPTIHPFLHFLSSPKPESQEYSPVYHILQVLDRSPHVASYIQSLKIECSLWPPSIPLHWLRTDILLSFLIGRLPSISRIAIVGPHRLHRDIRTSHESPAWAKVAQGLIPVFYSPVSVHSLTELDITGVGLFPLNVLARCTSLKRLSILSDFCFDPRKKRVVNVETRPQLEYLHLRNLKNTKEMAAWFLLSTFPLDITRLQYLNVHPVKYPQLMALEDFSASAMSIKHLHIQTQDVQKVLSVCNPLNRDIIEECTSDIPRFIHKFKNIKSLTINFEYIAWISIDLASTPLPWFKGLCNVIAMFPTARRVSHVTVNIDFEAFPLDYMESIDWKDLEASLYMFTYPLTFSLNVLGVAQKIFNKFMEDEVLRGLKQKGSNISWIPSR